MSDLAKGACVTRKLRKAVSEGSTQEQKDMYWAGYAEGFLASLAARIPEVRKEMEQRLIYRELKEG